MVRKIGLIITFLVLLTTISWGEDYILLADQVIVQQTIDESGYSLVKEDQLVSSVDMWHYSSNRWGINQFYLSDNDDLNDEAILYNLMDFITSDEGYLQMEIPLSKETAEAFKENRGKIYFEGTNHDLKRHMTIAQKEIRLIEEDGISRLLVQYAPKINIKADYRRLFNINLNKAIPVIRPGFGYNIYSLFKGGRKIGTGFSGKERGLLSYESILKEGTGTIEAGNMIYVDPEMYNDRVLPKSASTSFFESHLEKSEDLMIGNSTFKNAGAVGLSFQFPLKYKIYVKSEERFKIKVRHQTVSGNFLDEEEYDFYAGKPRHIYPLNLGNYTVESLEMNTQELSDIFYQVTKEDFDDSHTIEFNYYYKKLEKTQRNKIPLEHQTNGQLLIGADDRSAEAFDISQGIPSSESLYFNFFGRAYVIDYEFKNITGVKKYPVTVERDYHLKWKVKDGYKVKYHKVSEYCYKSTTQKDSDGDGKIDDCPGHTYRKYKKKTSKGTLKKTYEITREYSYWSIDRLEVYVLDRGIVENDVLDRGTLEINSRFSLMPDVEYEVLANHLIEPTVKDIKLNKYYKNNGKRGKPSHPSTGTWKQKAEESVEKIYVRNDSLEIDGRRIMSSEYVAEKTSSPQEVPQGKIVHKDALFKEGVVINSRKENGRYPSLGELIYQKQVNVNGTHEPKLTKLITPAPEVVVHTPVVCRGYNLNEDDFNQLIHGKKADLPVILERASEIKFPTIGTHLNRKGYGKRDYAKYIHSREVKFPFDVYFDTDSRERSKFIAKNTWVSVEKEYTSYYVPGWVKEGEYTIDYRVRAINTPGSFATNPYLNQMLDTYCATDQKTVQVVGRIYGFKIIDIDNYPIWEEVFRTMKGSYVPKKENYFFVGNRTEEGKVASNRKNVLPILPGSHPIYTNVGAIPLGYKIRFTVETIGDYSNATDQLVLKPTYTYVSEEGMKNENIDLWSMIYTDGERKLMKIKDAGVPLSMVFDHPHRNVSEEELEFLVNSFGKNRYKMQTEEYEIGTCNEVILNNNVRSYIGSIKELPEEVSDIDAKRSKQRWYGEFMLPDQTYLVDDSVDLVQYAVDTNGLDFNEEIFKKEGYILVSFEISSSKGKDSSGKDITYKSELCDMFRIEGFEAKQKVWKKWEEEEFHFNSGDILFYDIDHRKSDDYGNYEGF